MFVQLNHNLLGNQSAASEVVGLRAVAKIVTGGFSDLELKVKAVNIISRGQGVDGYISITIPTSRYDLDAITDRVAGNVQLVISSLNALGESYAIEVFDYTIDDFRYDLGVNSGTYTLILRGDFSTPVKQAINLTSYSSKKKLTEQTALVQKYSYTVNPNDYRYYSVGADFTEGSISGKVVTMTLDISSKNNLTIEVETV